MNKHVWKSRRFIFPVSYRQFIRLVDDFQRTATESSATKIKIVINLMDRARIQPGIKESSGFSEAQARLVEEIYEEETYRKTANVTKIKEEEWKRVACIIIWAFAANESSRQLNPLARVIFDRKTSPREMIIEKAPFYLKADI